MTAPAEPRLQAVANKLLPLGIKGEQLSLLEDAWLPALEPFPWNAPQLEGFRLRGRILFEIGAVLLGAEPSAAAAPGELWSLLDAAQHCSDKQSRDHLLDAARSVNLSSKVPRELRPLTVTAAIAVTNASGRVSGIRRGLAAARHRFVGRIPKLPRR